MTAALLLALIVAAPDDSPAQPGEWGFRPFDGKVSETDPPAFVWRPQAGAKRYEVQVARDEEFAELAYQAKHLDLHCHCPHETLGRGEFFWRYRIDGSAWSKTRRFSIDESSVPFPMPSRTELLGRIPKGHPRLFVRPADLPALRKLAKGPRWRDLVQRCQKLLKHPPDVREPLKYQRGEIRGIHDAAWRERWWGNRKHTLAVTDGAATLAFAWLISQDERYAKEAKRLILAACDWDPKGATSYRYNDEAGMPFAWAAARAYTWLHGYLTEAERKRIRAVMQVRGSEIYRHLKGRRHIWRPYSSHANRAWHWLGEVATAFHGEIEGSDDAAWFALNVFYCAYPVWSDAAGGWHEGLAYWNSYLGRVTAWLSTLRSTYGIDGYRKPFFSRAGAFALYVAPPGETMGGFGDLTLGYDAKRARPLMTVFARMSGNPHWQWYVEQAGGGRLPGGYLGFLLGALEQVKAEPPRDLPSSVLFSGIGVAVLHSDLLDRRRDVQFMLKSSPMGTQSHGYESQNAFLLSVAGKPVFVRSGRRDLYGSPHHRNWMWRTKSVNSILVDGHGQEVHSNRRLGEIARFETSPDFDFVVGEAGRAYLGRLERFTRAVLFVKPHAIVIFDALEAKEPSTFAWTLHSPHEMRVDGRTVFARGAALRFVAPKELTITQTDRFDPPPKEWVKLKQWHLTASTTGKSRSGGFVTVIRPRCTERFDARVLADGCEFAIPKGRVVARWDRTGGKVSCVVRDEKGDLSGRFDGG